MPEDSTDSRRQLCNDLAASLSTAEGLHHARLWGLAGLPSGHARADAAAVPLETVAEAPITDEALPIGPWIPRQVDGELLFERQSDPPPDDPWPAQRTLRPKATLLPLRICFLGESTAAGWFYAPHLTPAAILETQLCAVKGAELFEVIDLTRVDLQPRELVPLLSASLQLRPDVLVVFAGNNWPFHFHSAGGVDRSHFYQAADAYRSAGARGLMRLAHEMTECIAKDVLSRVAKIAHAAAVPVILVVPEVNLADWERARPVAWLPEDRTNRWHALHRRALLLLDAGDYGELADAAAEMIDLDEGTCSTSYRLLAKAHFGLDRPQAACAACRAEVDSRAWDNFPNVPGAASAVQQMMRISADEHGFGCVDLPLVFGAYLDSKPPDRRLFLDYCHLTPEGMSVAMAALAAEVLSLTDAKSDPSDWDAVLVQSPTTALNPEVEARAQFMSALYNAHWMSPAATSPCEQAHYWLNRAVDTSPDIQDVMLGYLKTRSGPPETILVSSEQQRLSRSVHWQDPRIWTAPNLDPDTTAAMSTILERSGYLARAEVNRQLAEHHAPGTDAVNLLSPMHRWAVQDAHSEYSSFSYPERRFFRAIWPTSRFCLVWDKSTRVVLDVTLRVPGGTRSEVTLQVNGHQIEQLVVGSCWRRFTVNVDSELLNEGINRLTIEWPRLAEDGTIAIRDVLMRLEQGVATDLHPVFGEVFRLLALGRST